MVNYFLFFSDHDDAITETDAALTQSIKPLNIPPTQYEKAFIFDMDKYANNTFW